MEQEVPSRFEQLWSIDLPDGFELESTWVFIGSGYLDLDQAGCRRHRRHARPLAMSPVNARPN
jgi:hypothetical protein